MDEDLLPLKFSLLMTCLKSRKAKMLNHDTSYDHIYVCTRFPSFSETFVATEMFALAARGERVMVYPLRGSDYPNTNASVALLADGPGRWGLLRYLPVAIGKVARSCIFEHLRLRSTRDVVRIVYAAAHSYRMRRAIRSRIAKDVSVVFHAHFLDRPADTVALARHDRDIGVVTVHAGDSFQAEDNSLRDWRVAKFDRIFCASEFVKSNVDSFAPPSKTTIVRCGVDLTYLDSVSRMDRGSPSRDCIRVCTVARLQPKKNYPFAVAVVRQLISLGVFVDWHIVGEGPDRLPIERLVDDLPQGGCNVVFYGALQHPDAIRVIAQSEVSLLPSRVDHQSPDGIPVSLIESMALGLLCVSSDVGGISELILDGATGILADLGDPRYAADRVRQLLCDSESLKAVLTRGRERVLKEFNSTSSAALVLKEIDAISVARGKKSA